MLPLRLAGEGSREESGAGPHPVGFADSTSPVSRERCPQRHRFALRGWPVESIVRADLPMRLETSAGARITLGAEPRAAAEYAPFRPISPGAAPVGGLRGGLARRRGAQPGGACRAGVGLRACRQ